MKNNNLLLMVLFSTSVLVGCKANQDSLKVYVEQVEGQARKDVAKLKPIIQFEVAHYAQHESREPFVLPKEAIVQHQPVRSESVV